MGAALDPETTKTYTATPGPGRGLVGMTLGGRYEVTSILGVGGMGIVCEARHLQLGQKRFAVKLIQRTFAKSDLAMTRFRREVRAVSAIESDHIVKVTDVGVDERYGLFMVMERLHGEDLATYLHRERRLRPSEAVRIALQVARGLSKAHQSHILHRDLKPGNIFLSERDDGTTEVKIFDFGISKLLADPDMSGTWSADLTSIGMPVGTPQYMSPEQAHGVGDLDVRTDVWAVGTVLFEMLAGRPVYEPRGRPHHTILRVMTEPPPRLEVVAPWVPPALARIVNASLAHDRDRRIPDCEAFAELLEQAIPAALRPTSKEPSSRPRVHDEVTVRAEIPPLGQEKPSSVDVSLSELSGSASEPPPAQVPNAPTSHVRELVQQPKTVLVSQRNPERKAQRTFALALLLLVATAGVALGQGPARAAIMRYAAAPATR